MLKSSGSFESVGAAVGAAAGTYYDILTIELFHQTAGYLINCEIANIGAALTDFRVQLQDHENGEFYTFMSGSDWSSTTLTNLLFSTTSPQTLADGSKGHVQFRANGARRVKFQAKAATLTVVIVRGNLRGS